MKSSLYFVIFTCLALIHCTENNLPKYNALDRLRVLALVAQTPEVNPSANVTIIPIVSDIHETSTLNYSALACLDLGISYGAEPTCEGQASTVVLGNGPITTLNSNHIFTGQADSVMFSVPDQATLLDLRSPAQQHNGVAYIFEYVLKNSRGEEVRAIKRITVSHPSKTSKNANPIINDLLMDGVSAPNTLPLDSTRSTHLSFTGSPKEIYTRMNNSGELISETEELITTWFITDGKMKSQRTLDLEPNEYQVPSQAPIGRPSYLIGITRDGRGGTGFFIKCFGVCI